METQLNIDPARAMEFMHSYQGNIVRKVRANMENSIASIGRDNAELSPADHGNHARRIPQSAQHLNYQIRLINLVV